MKSNLKYLFLSVFIAVACGKSDQANLTGPNGGGSHFLGSLRNATQFCIDYSLPLSKSATDAATAKNKMKTSPPGGTTYSESACPALGGLNSCDFIQNDGAIDMNAHAIVYDAGSVSGFKTECTNVGGTWK